MRLIGIDEVGRGAWAGPLIVGAVSLNRKIDGITDSKILSRVRRRTLAIEILKSADYVGFGWASNQEIDEYGLSAAMNIAVRRSLNKLNFNAKIIIDGNINYLSLNKNCRAVVKADSKFLSVSAASIVAKEFRDNFMRVQSLLFPEYIFDKNVGYGTKEHIEALNMHGICKIHRKTYKPVIKVINGTA